LPIASRSEPAAALTLLVLVFALRARRGVRQRRPVPGLQAPVTQLRTASNGRSSAWPTSD
jgi:hypothetical protein